MSGRTAEENIERYYQEIADNFKLEIARDIKPYGAVYQDYKVKKEALEIKCEEPNRIIKSIEGNPFLGPLTLVSYIAVFLYLCTFEDSSLLGNIFLSLYATTIALGILVGYFSDYIYTLLSWGRYSKVKKELGEYRKEILRLKESTGNKVSSFEGTSKEKYEHQLADYHSQFIFQKRSESTSYKAATQSFISMLEFLAQLNKVFLTTSFYWTMRKYADYFDKREKSVATRLRNGDKAEQPKKDNAIDESLMGVVRGDKKAGPYEENSYSAKQINADNTPPNKGQQIKIERAVERVIYAPPKVAKKEAIPPEREYAAPRKIDWEKLNKSRAATGLQGEEVVLKLEQDYLRSVGKADLASKVQHASRADDGLGYDILSFFDDGKSKYIEVKSTASSLNEPFYISKNELEFLKGHPVDYFIYRVSIPKNTDESISVQAHLGKEIPLNNELIPTQYLVKSK